MGLSPYIGCPHSMDEAFYDQPFINNQIEVEMDSNFVHMDMTKGGDLYNSYVGGCYSHNQIWVSSVQET